MHLVALAAVLTILATMTGQKVFVSAPLGGQGSMNTKTQQRLLGGSNPSLWNVKPSMQVPRDAHSWFLGSAALLVASAAVAVQASQKSAHLAQPRRCVVACHAMAAPIAQKASFFPKMPVAVSTPPESTSGVCLLDMQGSTFCEQASEPVSPPPLASVFMAADLTEKVAAPSSRSVTSNTHCPARFVAGVRFPASYRAGKRTNPRTAHSARRAVGARLVAKVQYPEVPEPSFDISRIPMQIQAALQSRSRVGVQHAREYKAPVTTDGGQAEHVLIKTICLLSRDHNKT